MNDSAYNDEYYFDKDSYNHDEPWCHDPERGRKVFTSWYIFLTLVILAGIIGNILVVLTLQIKCSKTVTNFLLKTLAVWDGSFLLVVCIYTLLDLRQIISMEPMIGLRLLEVKHHMVPVMLVLQLLSIWHLVSIGLYQFLNIYKPFWVDQYCTIRKAYIFVFCNVIVCTLLHTPTFIMAHKIKSAGDAMRFVYQAIFYQAPLSGPKYYMYFLFGCMYFLVPVTLLLVFNIGIIIAICKSARSQTVDQQRGSVNTDVKDITKTVVAILIAYIVTYTPCILAILDVWLSNNFSRGSIFFKSFRDCASIVGFLVMFGVLPFINSSINCLIYLLVRKSFRKSVKELLTCKKERGTMEEMTVFDVDTRV